MSAGERARPPTIDRFRFDALIGSGAFGDVYRAHDKLHGAPVAVKVLRRASAQQLRRLKREFRSLADVAHPNLVRLYELLADGDECCLVMELIDGVDLAAWVSGSRTPPANDAPVDLERARAALRQVADGLAALHASGNLHCDMKPSNVLVTREGRAVVLDFGFMRELQPVASQSIDDGLGTIAYMSPEQSYGLPLTEASDWYSFGVMLFEVLTGRLPFTGNAFHVLHLKTQEDAPDPAALRPDAPADLVDLCRRLLARPAALRPDAAAVLRALGGAPPAASAPAPVAAVSALVGRDRELAALGEAAHHALDGRPRLVAIHGQSGIGKTTLLHQHLDALSRSGAFLVLRGRCYEFESVPFKALDGVVDALVRRLQSTEPARVEAALRRGATSLTQLFPAFAALPACAARDSRAAAPADPWELRRRAAADLCALLSELGGARQVVLAIDDLHWADVDSAELIKDILRQSSERPVHLVVCYRSEGRERSACVRALFEARLPVEVCELEVRPLTASAAEALAASLVARGDGERAARIARESGGNPFFLQELTRHVGDVSELAGLTLEELVRARVERLAPATQRLARAIALASGAVPTAIALLAAQIDDGHAALAALRAAHLVRSLGAGVELLAPYHDKVREVVAASLTDDEARRLHAALADAWETHPAPEHETLLVHRRAAGDDLRAAHHAEVAAGRAAAALAFDHAATLYRLALTLGAASDAGRRQLHDGLGRALIGAGRGREAAQALLAAADGAAPFEGLARRRLAAEQLLCAGYIDEGLAVARGLLDAVGLALPSSATGALASLMYHRARVRVRGIAFTERRADACDPDGLARIDTGWSVAMGLAVIDVVRAASLQSAGLRLALDAGEPYRVARALAMEAAFSAAEGLSSRARTASLVEASRGLARRIAHPHALALCEVTAGLAAWCEGRWGDARETMERALHLLDAGCTGATWERNTATIFLLDALSYLGDWRELRARAPRMLADAQDRGDLYSATLSHIRFECIEGMADDDPDRALAGLERVRRWSRAGFHSIHLIELHERTEIALYRGDGRRAHDDLTARWGALEASLLLEVQACRVQMLFLRGRAALAASRAPGSAARALVRSASADAARIARERTAWGDAFAALLRAGVAAHGGSSDTVAAALDGAARALDATSMRLHAGAARRQLGQLRGGAEGRALVAEVDAAMAAQGIRNPSRIAAMLAPVL